MERNMSRYCLMTTPDNDGTYYLEVPKRNTVEFSMISHTCPRGLHAQVCATQSKAYRVFNKRTRMIVETIHVNFDELPQMTSVHNSSGLDPQCQMTSVHNSSGLDPQCQMMSVHNSSGLDPQCQMTFD
ncbi:hypothetical protein Tco_0216762 [Tanacetum coccineum]